MLPGSGAAEADDYLTQSYRKKQCSQVLNHPTRKNWRQI